MTNTPSDPLDAAESALVEALLGRPLVAASNRTRGRCRRCLRKNAIRRELGRPDLSCDPSFDDGERVLVDAVAHPTESPVESQPVERAWAVTAVYHERHARRPPEAVARPDVAQAALSATVRAEGWVYQREPDVAAGAERVPEALVLRDVSVSWLSPRGEGTPPAPAPGASGERRHLDPEDPRPDWPAETERWRAGLVRRVRGQESPTDAGPGSTSDPR